MHGDQIKAGERFAFGDNWTRFAEDLGQDQIDAAVGSLRSMLGIASLEGKRFLDIGSGSGLFSLAARRLGAKVHSFDFDPDSVACTRALRSRYFPEDPDWKIEEGSVLDADYVAALGKFDVVYSWGVLHHTGRMSQAIENAISAVDAEGRAFIAIYNDQGPISRYWYIVKRAYNKSVFFKWLAIFLHAPYLIGLRVLVRFLTGRRPIERGMSLWHDMLDWLGGYPFEVAKPETILRVFRNHGFVLEELRTCGGRMGCNEFVFGRFRSPH